MERTYFHLVPLVQKHWQTMLVGALLVSWIQPKGTQVDVYSAQAWPHPLTRPQNLTQWSRLSLSQEQRYQKDSIVLSLLSL